MRDLEGLPKIERLIEEKLSSEAPRLTEIGSYLLGLGGKRIRPVLTLLSARACGMAAPSPALIQVAAGIELIHMATLLHDDIIDKSPRRRNQESPLVRYGVEDTLLCGDFLLTRAFSLCAHLDRYIIDCTEEACINLTEGEILEVPLHKKKHSVETSLLIAEKKTAALFRLGALCGAHLSGVSPHVVNEMASFGEQLGIAFQILDDILDVTADENLLGKKSGVDLAERKPSLVNVLWVESGSQLAKMLHQTPSNSEQDFVDAALRELRGSAVIERARELACAYASKAQHALEICVRSGEKGLNQEAFATLGDLVQYTIDRLG